MYYIMYREPNDFQVKTWDIRDTRQIPLFFNDLSTAQIHQRPKYSAHQQKKGAFSAPSGVNAHPPWYHCSSNFGYYVIQSDRTSSIDSTPLPIDSYPAE